MSTKSKWENFYSKTPLDKIPWNTTQADFFHQLLYAGKLGQGKALDLGCGLGNKSIALAKHNFQVTSIDISPTAIELAKKQAKKEKINVNFIVADVTNLSFLKNEQFNLILDWANLHGIPQEKRDPYVKEILKHCKPGGLFLLRCFSKHDTSKNTLGFLTPMGSIYLFSKKDIQNLFGSDFKITNTNRSKPRNHPYLWFEEYLMVKKL